jgi:biopolymer transport protein ExbB
MRRATTRLLLIAALGLAAGVAHAQAEPLADQEAGEVSAADAASPAGEAPAEPAAAPAPTTAKPKSLFELLDVVKQGLEVEREENRLRVEQFIQRQEEQQRLLAEARARLARAEATSQELETSYNENEVALGEKEEQLTQRLGELGELFGMVRLVATDTSGNVWDSLTSSQLGPRKELLDRLGRSTELPSTEDLEQLWYELQQEMTQQGQVVRYRAPVLTTEVARPLPAVGALGGEAARADPAAARALPRDGGAL